MSSSNQFEEITLERGEVLFKKGDPCLNSYIVKSGHVACFSLSEDNRIIPTFTVRDNGVIAEDNIFSKEESYTYYAVILDTTTLVKIPNSEVMTFLGSSADWMKTIIFDLAKKVLKTMDIIVDHKILDERLNAGVELSSEDSALLFKVIS